MSYRFCSKQPVEYTGYGFFAQKIESYTVLAFCVPDIRKFDEPSKDETPDPDAVQFGSPSVDDALK